MVAHRILVPFVRVRVFPRQQLYKRPIRLRDEWAFRFNEILSNVSQLHLMLRRGLFSGFIVFRKVFSWDYLAPAYHDCTTDGIKNRLGLYHSAGIVSATGVRGHWLCFEAVNVHQSILPQFRMEYGLREPWFLLY